MYNKIKEVYSTETPISQTSKWEKNKGRIEHRIVYTYENLDGISKDWIGLNQLIVIDRRIFKKGKITEEQCYYISSKKTNAMEYMYGIRSHWSIENGLHWTKDVTMHEDSSKIRAGNAPEILSTIRNMTINLLRIEGQKNIASARRLIANDISKLKKLIFEIK